MLHDQLVRIDADLRDHLQDVARRIHSQLISEQARPGEEQLAASEIRLLARDLSPLCTDHEVEALVTMVNEQLWGLGPLDELLSDPTITEVMVNGPGPVWIERRGEVACSSIRLDDAALRLIIDRIVGPLGLRLDRVVPFVDARLADGSRVHIAIPPMALDGPYVTIRRFGAEPWNISDFAQPDVAELVQKAVGAGKSALISGSTGSGKTSLLNAMAGELGTTQRVVTIEDAAELQLPGDHVVRLEARPPNAEGIGEVTIRTLVRNALRMRPDRLIVGEVRGAEAFDMVQAMTTGHAGSMTTCHANGPIEALDRVVSMLLMSDVALPPELARSQVLTAVDLVVHVTRASAGHRRIDAVLGVASRSSAADPVQRLHEQHVGGVHSPEAAVWWPWLAQRCHDANVSLEVRQLLAIAPVAALVTVPAALMMGSVSAVAVASAITVVLPTVVLVQRRQRRRQAIAAAVPFVLDALARSMRAGASLSIALRQTITAAPAPLAGCLRTIVASVDLGQPLDAAWNAMADEEDSPELKRVAALLALLTLGEAGGGDALENAARSFRLKATLREEVGALVAQAELSMHVLAALPLGFVALGLAFGNDSSNALFTTPFGRLCLGVGIALELAGAIWMRALLRRAKS